jgi:hypothetical protein
MSSSSTSASRDASSTRTTTATGNPTCSEGRAWAEEAASSRSTRTEKNDVVQRFESNQQRGLRPPELARESRQRRRRFGDRGSWGEFMVRVMRRGNDEWGRRPSQADLVRSNPWVGLNSGPGGYFVLLTKGFLRKFRKQFKIHKKL